jgi:hypothetical protein
VVEDNLIEGGHLKLFKLAEGECFNLDEIPLVSKLQNGRPLFDVCLIDRVLFIVKYPKEALEIDPERVLEDKGIVIGRSFAKLARRGRVGKFFEENRRIACEEVAVDTEYTVFHAEDNVSSGNVIVRMAHDALVEWARAHGRGHCHRQKIASLGSSIVERNWRRGER